MGIGNKYDRMAIIDKSMAVLLLSINDYFIQHLTHKLFDTQTFLNLLKIILAPVGAERLWTVVHGGTKILKEQVIQRELHLIAHLKDSFYQFLTFKEKYLKDIIYSSGFQKKPCFPFHKSNIIRVFRCFI